MLFLFDSMIISSLISLLLFLTLFVSPVSAQCPVCTVAVGGGVLLSRYLGIDDLVIGIWAGAFVISSGLWTATLIKKQFIKYQEWILVVLLWITTVLGLKQAGFIGNPTCRIHGHDKLLTGIIAGSLVFLLAYAVDKILRRINKTNPGKAHIPYQKVIIPVGLLIIATIIGYKICQLTF